ncbi:MAG: hypothetical protein M3Z13_01375 [Candidatus Dormibacteraeota bacterium]|nr:hypothetical protein [Candidatus Dormibacteraeota bacterium]
MTLRCAVCHAPAIVLASACVFCRTPLEESDAPAELLQYLADRLPGATIRRSFGLGPIRQVTVTAAGRRYEARRRRGRLVLSPSAPPARWLDTLLGALSEAAKTDAQLRANLSKSGWALR